MSKSRSEKKAQQHVMKRRLLGASVLIALAVIFLPLLLDGSGTESRFRRVEQVRQEPPRILDSSSKSVAIVTVDESADAVIHDKTVPLPDEAPQISETVDGDAGTVETVASAAKTESEPESKPEPRIVATAVPELAPKPEEVVEPEPVATVDAVKEILNRQSTGTPEPAAAAARPAVKRANNSAQVSEASAWVIQAGSFSQQDRATSLRDRLRGAGFPVFSSKATADGTTVYRVKVGPVASRARAETLQQQINEMLSLSSIIRPYQ